MEFVSQEGRFWLPRQPKRVVHGTVIFQEEGVTLNLADSLRGPVSRSGGGFGGSPSLASEPIIYGRLLDGREVSLQGARGMSWPVDGIQESWRADFLFIGGLITGDRFTQVQVVFDCLMPWAAPAGIARGEIHGDDVSIDTRRITVNQAILGDRTKVRLRTGVEGRWDHSRVHLDQWTAFEVTSLVRKAKTIRGVLEDWVRPLQESGQLENTLVVLVSDNGASGEGGPNGSVNENKYFNGIPDTIKDNLKYLDVLGSAHTYNHYPTGWAWAFNTPFKMWKRYAGYQGGTADLMIVSWPKQIKKAAIRRQYTHAVDIVPPSMSASGSRCRRS